MFDAARYDGNIPGTKPQLSSCDSERDPAAQHERDLLLGMCVHWKERSRLIQVAHDGLLVAVDRLPVYSGIHLFNWKLVPVRDSGFADRPAQNTNHPANSASESRKKKMLATPPPVTR